MRKYFGTDGIRRIANTELTPNLVFRVAKAGAYILAKHSTHTPTILIGRDTRISGTLIESAMTAGFLSYGANVKLLGVIPTPGAAYLTRELKADACVVISASHNTFEFNGVKYFSNKGTKIPDSIEEEIEEIMDSEQLSALTAVGEKIGVSENAEDYVEKYIDFFVNLFKDDFKDLPKDFCVGLDTANGATYKIAEEVYKRLGINFKVINNSPNGLNINDNCGSTHMNNISNFVKENKLSLGFAYDGDGDRCLAVDEKGEIMDGDIIMAILADYFKRNNELKNNALVATVMSNLGLTKFAKNEKVELKQTKVGDRYVLEEMLKNGYNLGGEQSGHIIFLDYNPTGDGILTSLMLLKAIKGKKASEAKKVINIYPQILLNAKVINEKKFDYDKDDEIKSAIEKVEKEFSENGRVLIRTSGTEPIVRVMIEGENQEYVTKKAQELVDLIEEKLGK